LGVTLLICACGKSERHQGDEAEFGGGASSGSSGENEGGAPTCGASYIECGCGCCVAQAAAARCFYPDLGESLDQIIAGDDERETSPDCANVGCSAGVERVCCAALPPNTTKRCTRQARTPADVNRIEISKTSLDCTILTLEQAVSTEPAALTLPPGWRLRQVTRQARRGQHHRATRSRRARRGDAAR
jgi:hypothetical protein